MSGLAANPTGFDPYRNFKFRVKKWVLEYQALPDLDANANGVAFEHIRLENEGWERDRTVVPPAKPVITT
jgi:hypothetical protein